MISIWTMMRTLGVGAALCLSPLAMAQTDGVQDFSDDQSLDDSISSEPLAAACFNFDGQPRRCENQGCNYSYRTNRCTRGGGGGGPGRQYFVCEARDRGFEEHFNGHAASGWTQVAARQGALNECRRYHGNCLITNCYVQR